MVFNQQITSLSLKSPAENLQPEDYHKSYESDGDGEIGYARKKSGGGKKGYQHFDSYHKKAGDNYEFEKQDSYGHDNGEQERAHSHRHEKGELRRPLIRRPLKFAKRFFKWFF